MKKLLSIFCAAGIMLGSSLTTISCNSNHKFNIASKDIQIPKTEVQYGTEYDAITQYEDWQISNDSNIDITKIINDKNISIKLYVNNKVAPKIGNLGYGDSVYITVSIAKNDQYFIDTAGKKYIKSNTINVNKKVLSNSSVDLSFLGFTVGTKYSEIYQDSRILIANYGGIKWNDIATGSEKNTVLLSLIVNDKAVVNGSLESGDIVSMKYWITDKSHHYAKGDFESKSINIS